jgi:glycosyltransferase involved in cell wall biosynthesis
LSKICNIGYFGSVSDIYCLSILNNLSVLLPSSEFKIHVCGSLMDSSVDVASGICYHGYLSGEAFDAFCADIDIFINPREYSETMTSYAFPSKLYEYMSHCKPVISTPVPHVSETTANFINFSSDYSVEAVKDRILDVWNNYDAFLLHASWQERYLRELDVGLVLVSFFKELK